MSTDSFSIIQVPNCVCRQVRHYDLVVDHLQHYCATPAPIGRNMWFQSRGYPQSQSRSLLPSEQGYCDVVCAPVIVPEGFRTSWIFDTYHSPHVWHVTQCHPSFIQKQFQCGHRPTAGVKSGTRRAAARDVSRQATSACAPLRRTGASQCASRCCKVPLGATLGYPVDELESLLRCAQQR